MKFEQAFQAMREGKKVKRQKNYNPIMMFDDSIIEVVNWNREQPIDFEPLNSIRCINILAEDWEIVDD